jgi:hypothetical protein
MKVQPVIAAPHRQVRPQCDKSAPFPALDRGIPKPIEYRQLEVAHSPMNI